MVSNPSMYERVRVLLVMPIIFLSARSITHFEVPGVYLKIASYSCQGELSSYRPVGRLFVLEVLNTRF